MLVCVETTANPRNLIEVKNGILAIIGVYSGKMG